MRAIRAVTGRVFVVVALVAAGLFASSRPAAAVGTWSVVPSSNPTGPALTDLRDVACVSATDCFAVGRYGFGGPSLPLIERWDGATWSLMDVPDVPGNMLADLRAVACASSTSCFAVGALEDTAEVPDEEEIVTTLVMQWDGLSWSIVTSPSPSTLNALNGVTCLSETDCFAVGARSNLITTRSLVERWDGVDWTVVPSPNVSGVDNELLDVTCPSATRCLAVGGTDLEFGDGKPLAMKWDDTAWAITNTPLPGAAGFFSSVSCAAPGNCFAVGGAAGAASIKPIVRFWNGSGWKSVTTPAAPGFLSQLLGISCSGASHCVAVGVSGRLSALRTLVQEWNGTTWSLVDSPSPGGGKAGILVSASCISDSACVAIGDDDLQGFSFSETFDGATWEFEGVAFPQGSANALTGVACPRPTTCFAVGATMQNGRTKPLVLRGTGGTWSTVPLPNLAGVVGDLTSISCPSQNRCYAVGVRSSGEVVKPLVVRWDGTSWSIVNVPLGSPFFNLLFDISCSSAQHCVAVGVAFGTSTIHPLILRWNGTKWSVLQSAPTGDVFSLLLGVMCRSRDGCFAVGGGEVRPLTERWNGNKWSALPPAPMPPAAEIGDLTGVRCPVPGSCLAVGTALVGDTDRAFSVRWNGHAWVLVTVPKPGGATHTALGALTCLSGTNCIAVGAARIGGIDKPLVEHWNGTSWSVGAPETPVDADSSQLQRVACATPSQCFAVGAYVEGAELLTLVEEYTP
jgi:hypothetical protein